MLHTVQVYVQNSVDQQRFIMYHENLRQKPFITTSLLDGFPQKPDAEVQHVKLVLLGDQGVGKSSIALRFVRGEFRENLEATIGAPSLTQKVSVESQNQRIKFDIWDTAGQERYQSLVPMFYRGAHAAVVVYDVSSVNSYKRALAWIRQLRQQTNSQIVLVLAGNKADIADSCKAVLTEDASTYARDNGLIFYETSAKTGMGVNEVFYNVAQRLAWQLEQTWRCVGRADSLRLRGGAENKKGGCC